MSLQSPIGLDYRPPEKPPGLKYFFLVMLPLILGVVELPWYFAVVLVAWFVLGDPTPTKDQTEMFITVAVLPSALGVICGVSVIIGLTAAKRITTATLVVASIGLASCCCGFWLARQAILHG